MRRCLSLRSSCTLRCPASSKRLYAAKLGQAQNALPEEQELKQSLAGSNAVDYDHGDTKASANSNVISIHATPSARPPLPLSPLMDPAYIAAKEKHRLPKPLPSKEPTPFQKQLAKNPYAHALATPVRMCALTRTWLPSFFLQDFEAVTHPTTGMPWQVPRSLASSSPIPDLASPSSSAETQTLGMKTYTLSRMSLLRALFTGSSGFDRGYLRFGTRKNESGPKTKVEFRMDVDTFVLKLMRRRIVENLKYLCSLKRGYLVECKDGGSISAIGGIWADAKKKKQTAAMLWMGPIAGSDKETAAEPKEFSTIDLDKDLKSKIPVFNLQMLLGPAHVEDLRKHAPQMFATEVVVLKQKGLTLDLQLRLWKLQGYVAEYKDFVYSEDE